MHRGQPLKLFPIRVFLFFNREGCHLAKELQRLAGRSCDSPPLSRPLGRSQPLHSLARCSLLHPSCPASSALHGSAHCNGHKGLPLGAAILSVIATLRGASVSPVKASSLARQADIHPGAMSCFKGWHGYEQHADCPLATCTVPDFAPGPLNQALESRCTCTLVHLFFCATHAFLKGVGNKPNCSNSTILLSQSHLQK